MTEPNAVHSIGELAKRTGAKVQTIRYCAQVGLMPQPGRTARNQRFYGKTHVDRLAFIRPSRKLSFPLGAIRELLDLSDDPNRQCDRADRIARAHLHEVKTRIVSLVALKSELERMVRQCRRGRIADCRAIEILADHAKCATDDHHARATAALALGAGAEEVVANYLVGRFDAPAAAPSTVMP